MAENRVNPDEWPVDMTPAQQLRLAYYAHKDWRKKRSDALPTATDAQLRDGLSQRVCVSLDERHGAKKFLGSIRAFKRASSENEPVRLVLKMSFGECLLVDYQLVRLGKAIPLYDADAHWAGPSVDHAASLMRQVYENQSWAADLGAKA